MSLSLPLPSSIADLESAQPEAITGLDSEQPRFKNHGERREYYSEHFNNLLIYLKQQIEEAEIEVSELINRAMQRTTEPDIAYRAALVGDDAATAAGLDISYQQQVKFVAEFFSLSGKEIEVRTSQQPDPFGKGSTKSYRVSELTPATVTSLLEYSLAGFFPRQYRNRATPTVTAPGSYPSLIAIPDRRAGLMPPSKPHHVWIVPGLTPNKFAARAKRWSKKEDFTDRQILSFTLDLASDHNVLPPDITAPGSHTTDDIIDALRDFYAATTAPTVADIGQKLDAEQILVVSNCRGIALHVRLPAALESSEATELASDISIILQTKSKQKWKSEYATQPQPLPLSFNPEFDRFNLIIAVRKSFSAG